MSNVNPDRIIESERKQVVLKEEYKGMQILDIGGGGEGIIGSLYGRNVVAIDRKLSELEEANNDAIKIVMDACDLKFTDNLFEVATSFFTLMYMNEEEKEKCILEIKRVLKVGGILEIWDTHIPKYDGGEKDIFLLQLQVDLPNRSIDTGYGVLMQAKEQNTMSIKDILIKNGFKIKECEEDNSGLFRMKCSKEPDIA